VGYLTIGEFDKNAIIRKVIFGNQRTNVQRYRSSTLSQLIIPNEKVRVSYRGYEFT
jgi:hypothetical protein